MPNAFAFQTVEYNQGATRRNRCLGLAGIAVFELN